MSATHSKHDAAAQKSVVEANPKSSSATARSDSGSDVDLKAVAKAVEANDAVPAKTAEVTKAAAAKREAAPQARSAAKTRTASKTRSAKTKARAAKPASQKPAPANQPSQPRSTPINKTKDTVMATANTDFAATAKDAAAELQNRAKTAYDKSAALTGEVTEFHKGNLAALVETGKLLANGVQDLGRTYMEDARTAADTVTEDVKKMAAIKSPTELFQLQGEIARRNFDAVIAQTSKNTEAMMKLVTEAFAPLSNRASVAVEKVSNAA